MSAYAALAQSPRGVQVKPALLTCLVQKCQSFSISVLCFRLTSHQTATAPKRIPYVATKLTQASMKHGVKSYR